MSSNKPEYADSVVLMNGCLGFILKIIVYSFIVILIIVFGPLIALLLLAWWIVAWVLGLAFPGREFFPIRKIWNAIDQWMQEKLDVGLGTMVGVSIASVLLGTFLSYLDGLFKK